MDANDDFYAKELNLNCFYMHTIFGQKYSKPAIVFTSKHEVTSIDLKCCDRNAEIPKYRVPYT